MRFHLIDVSPQELLQLVEERASGALLEEGREKLRAAIETLITVEEMLGERGIRIKDLRNLLHVYLTTEKTCKVLPDSRGTTPTDDGRDGKRDRKKKGHGRNGTAQYTGAEKVPVPHPTLKPKDHCPECLKGKVYPLKEPRSLIRLIGQPPVKATSYELQALRCNLCGEVFTPQPPPTAGQQKYDATVVSIIAVLKYGSGFPFHRVERLQSQFGIPLPTATQWDLVAAAATVLKPVWDELIRQAAQGRVVHNDDTSMRILCFLRDASDSRTGLFTSGVVSLFGQRRIALFFTGGQHAGENLADLLLRREAELGPPIQMCDALSRNTPKPLRVILANCLAHGRRHFVDVVQNFPDECRHVLETLGKVFHNDALASREQLSPDERLRLHQRTSAPVMEQLADWCHRQLDERKVEPNSGLGKAIQYMLRHWEPLTLFLREPGAPIDNNVCERALKKAILHRKNSLFYRTKNGARVGDLFMSLIHTAELCAANPFDYLTQLLRHADDLARAPADWLPWNYQAALPNSAAA
jgi:transposase